MIVVFYTSGKEIVKFKAKDLLSVVDVSIY